MDQLDEFKKASRAMWALGDYDEVVRTDGLYVVGERLVRDAAVEPSDRVLDVACGTGNAAVPAARTGAMVTGIDLAPEMLVTASRRAAREGVSVEWQQGDAEDLPFPERSFDVVVSSFGAMFAPRHAVVANELRRVLRPGGRLAMANWAPEGSIGEFFAVTGPYGPALPDFVDPPLSWGDEGYVRELFDGADLDLDLGHEVVRLRAPSVDAAVELYTTHLGPFAQTRRAAEAEGRWPAMREDFAAFFDRHNTADDGSLEWPAPYLVVLGRVGA